MNTRKMMRTKRQAGFSLVEILVTTAIIGILVGIVFGIAGLAGKKSDTNKALAEMHLIRNALEEYRLQFGSFPTNLSLVTSKMDQPYKSVKLTDPWGRAYIYSNNSAYAYTLISAGPKSTDNHDDIDSASGNF